MAKSTEITSEMIAARAFERFADRGYQDGNDVEDWLAAEAELRAELMDQAQKMVRRNSAPRSTTAPKTVKR